MSATPIRPVLERGWAVRVPGSRALRVTGEGVVGLRAAFGLDLAA